MSDPRPVLTAEEVDEKMLLIARGRVAGHLNAICDSHAELQLRLAERDATIARRLAEAAVGEEYRDTLRRERDEARAQFDRHVVWAAEQANAAKRRLAEVEAERDAAKNDWSMAAENGLKALNELDEARDTIRTQAIGSRGRSRRADREAGRTGAPMSETPVPPQESR